MELQGIYTALLTPFDSNDKINEKALVQLIQHNIKLGVQGFYVGGSTAEAFLLTTEERKQVMDICKAAAGDKKLIAHIGSISEKEALELALHAKELGYDAISSVAPFYYKFSFEEIKNYYFRLAEKSGMPVVVYHFPAFSGVSMGVKEIAAFLEDDRFIGIKFTSNDFFTMEQVRAKFPNKLVFNGYDEMMLAGLSMGADGGIGSTYNFMADKFVKIRELFEVGDIAQAQKIQKEANRIITILCQIGVMQAEKEVLNQLGIDFGNCRKPFSEPTQEQKDLIAKEIIPYITAL
ncbi:MAG: N-acetylneuraminate lyase [Oscillospiraceae bacterium]|nr:N-acetylneuraminate lyase [Oscillospiraceae bacterium]